MSSAERWKKGIQYLRVTYERVVSEKLARREKAISASVSPTVEKLQDLLRAIRG